MLDGRGGSRRASAESANADCVALVTHHAAHLHALGHAPDQRCGAASSGGATGAAASRRSRRTSTSRITGTGGRVPQSPRWVDRHRDSGVERAEEHAVDRGRRSRWRAADRRRARPTPSRRARTASHRKRRCGRAGARPAPERCTCAPSRADAAPFRVAPRPSPRGSVPSTTTSTTSAGVASSPTFMPRAPFDLGVREPTGRARTPSRSTRRAALAPPSSSYGRRAISNASP